MVLQCCCLLAAPLSMLVSQVERIKKLMEPWKFDKLHGAFASAPADGYAIVQRSAMRYIGFLNGTEKRQYF